MEKEIVKLFLEKVDILTEEERRVLIKTIHLICHPIIITGKPTNPLNV